MGGAGRGTYPGGGESRGRDEGVWGVNGGGSLNTMGFRGRVRGHSVTEGPSVRGAGRGTYPGGKLRKTQENSGKLRKTQENSGKLRKTEEN